jgi:hypothetical protein
MLLVEPIITSRVFSDAGDEECDSVHRHRRRRLQRATHRRKPAPRRARAASQLSHVAPLGGGGGGIRSRVAGLHAGYGRTPRYCRPHPHSRFGDGRVSSVVVAAHRRGRKSTLLGPQRSPACSVRTARLDAIELGLRKARSVGPQRPRARAAAAPSQLRAPKGGAHLFSGRFTGAVRTASSGRAPWPAPERRADAGRAVYARCSPLLPRAGPPGGGPPALGRRAADSSAPWPRSSSPQSPPPAAPRPSPTQGARTLFLLSPTPRALVARTCAYESPSPRLALCIYSLHDH